MKRSILAVISLILIATLVFAGCTKKKYVTDDHGVTHVAITDENGETMTNEDGEIVIAATDEKGRIIKQDNGEIETGYIDGPLVTFDTENNTAKSPAYTLTVPEGWKVSNSLDYIQVVPSSASTAKLDINYSEDDYETSVAKNNSFYKEIKDTAEKNDEVKIVEMTQDEVTLKNGEISPVTKTTVIVERTTEGEEGSVYFTSYVFASGKWTISINFSAENKEDFENTDYMPVIDAIQFK